MRLLVRLARERREGAPGEDTSGARRGHERSGARRPTRASGAAREGERPRRQRRGGEGGEPDAEGGRGSWPPQPGADQPPDRPEPDGQPRDRQDPRPAHNLQTRSIRPHPGRRPRHRELESSRPAEAGLSASYALRASLVGTLRPCGLRLSARRFAPCQHACFAGLSAAFDVEPGVAAGDDS